MLHPSECLWHSNTQADKEPDQLAKLNTTKYADTVSTIQEYYSPQPFLIVQQFKLNTRVRGPNETIAQYICGGPA